MTPSNRFPARSMPSTDIFPVFGQFERMPQTLRVRGTPPKHSSSIITIVGTRSPSSYGIACCKSIVAGLAGYDVCIASGLAYGIDGVALEAAVEAGLATLAYPGSGISDESIYPKVHVALAHKILESGGAIVSHFGDNEPARPYFFPERNRCLAALSNIVVVIECIKKSGTMITAMAAADFNVSLGAVPGPITSELSAGPHELFRHGAEPIECARDILKILGYVADARNDRGDEPPDDCGPEERSIYKALRTPKTQDQLLDELELPAHDLARWLTVLELKGHIAFRAGTIERT